jgi:hypothetical protein
MKTIFILINICAYLSIVNGHGYLLEPPSRLYFPNDPGNRRWYDDGLNGALYPGALDRYGYWFGTVFISFFKLNFSDE